MSSISTQQDYIEVLTGVSFYDYAWDDRSQGLFPKELLQLLKHLHENLELERQALLSSRKERQEKYDAGELPQYLDKNSAAVQGNWQIAPIPRDLLTRRVEITGPVHEAKMVINMLSRNEAGDRADTAMLDFEDSMKPTWENVINGFYNVIGAASLTLTDRKTLPNGSEKIYKLDPKDMALPMIRVRGLHLNEINLKINDQPISAGLFDLGVCFFHTAKILIAQGKTPKYYVPKCEHYLEARWWNKLFTMLEEALEISMGTLKVTFLIETLPAAFQIEEILYEIRDHAVAMNVGRWDKIFSDIKVLKNHAERNLADRGTITMKSPWMLNYAKRLIKICHSRGALAIGGMAAFTPGKTVEMREAQNIKVAEDKAFEVSIGHDGCWVSHPYFIGVALKAFPKNHQLDVLLEDFDKYPDIMPKAVGAKTLPGLRKNLRVGMAYMQGWNSGRGCVAWDNMMEDLATMEISRVQVWQWLRHNTRLDDDDYVDKEGVKKCFNEEFEKICEEIRESTAGQPEEVINDMITQFSRAKDEAEKLYLEERFRDFLTENSYLARA